MKIIHFETVTSTFDYLKENYATLDEFTFVDADFQTSGVGRENREWISPKSENLLFSFILKNNKYFDNYQFVSLLSAVTVCETLNRLNIKATIKWPNDVYVGDKKICGILLKGNIPDYLLVGIGLNVNQREFKGEYRIIPTSIINEINKLINIGSFKKELYFNLEKELKKMNKEYIIKYIRNYNYLKNSLISFKADGDLKTGTVVDISDCGELLIKINDKIIPLRSGEINQLNKIK